MPFHIRLILASLCAITHATAFFESIASYEENTTLEERSLNILPTTDQVTTQSAERQSLQNAMDSALPLIQQALNALDDVSEPNLQYIFRASSDGLREEIRFRYEQLQTALSPSQGAEVTIFLDEDSWRQANPEILQGDQNSAYLCTINSANFWGWYRDSVIILCPPFYTYDPIPVDCWQTSQVGILIHMLIHQPSVTNEGLNYFNDAGIFGRNILNQVLPDTLPDAYQYYVSNVANKCVNGFINGVESEPDNDDNPPDPPDEAESLCNTSQCSDTSEEVYPLPAQPEAGS